MSRKTKGAYYTPRILTDFIVKHLMPKLDRRSLSILEPSVGDGAFINALHYLNANKSLSAISFVGIEKEAEEIQKAEVRSIDEDPKISFEFITGDFLDVNSSLHNSFDLVIGNPPYIKKTLLQRTQIEKCNAIHKSAGLAGAAIKNIWPAFLIRSCQLLDEQGMLAMVLPSDLLQVGFSTELRSFLKKTFERVEILTFDNLLFDCKGQDTIVLFGYKCSEVKGQYFANIDDIEQLREGNFQLSSNEALIKAEMKWSHHYLDSDDLLFINNLRKSISPVSYYADTKPGVVTGANSFFIVDSNTEAAYNLAEFTRPILQKGMYVDKQVNFTESDFGQLLLNQKNCKLISFNGHDLNSLSEDVRRYLELGVRLELPKRYKCSKRKEWYIVPNISDPAEGFFLKRCHYYPKVLLNSADVLISDSGYMIKMKPGFTIKSFVYSFYNSLTFLFAEVLGRFYGGGVLELTPKEFQQLPMPIVACSGTQFLDFSYKFQQASNYQPYLNDVDILQEKLLLNQEDFDRILRIKKQLIEKRMSKLIIKEESSMMVEL